MLVLLRKTTKCVYGIIDLYRRISWLFALHYGDVKMSAMASQITSLAIVYSTVYSGVIQRKYQCSASMAFVWGIHRRPVNSPHKWPVMRKMFPLDDIIMSIWKTTRNRQSYQNVYREREVSLVTYHLNVVSLVHATHFAWSGKIFLSPTPDACSPLLVLSVFIGAGQPLQHGEVKASNLAWVRPVIVIYHDDVIKWKHFPRYWPFVWGIHRSPVNSPHKGQWRGALMFSMIYD